MKRILVKPDELWSFFKKNALKLEEHSELVAENGNRSIWVFNDDGIPSFIIYEGDAEVEGFELFDEEDDQYALALIAIGFGDDIEEESGTVSGEDYDEDDEDALIEEREEELNVVCENLIYDVLDSDTDAVTADEISQAAKFIKEVVCDILTKKFGFPVYRPMYLVDEDGKKFFAEYPYEQMIDDKS